MDRNCGLEYRIYPRSSSKALESLIDAGLSKNCGIPTLDRESISAANRLTDFSRTERGFRPVQDRGVSHACFSKLADPHRDDVDPADPQLSYRR